MKVDEITPLLGNFGRYQLVMVCYLSLYNIISCFTSLGNVFYSAGTDHWCSVLPGENCSSWPEFLDNCTQVKKAVLLPPAERNDSEYSHSNCKQWDLPDGYAFNPYVPLHDVPGFNETLVDCKEGWEFDTSQYKITTISEFGLVCEQGSLASLAQSLFFGGYLVGSFVGGAFSDWIGRKKVAIVLQFVWVTAFIATTFSVNIYMYMALRFIAGFGNLGAYLSLFVLVMEYVGNAWRTPVTMFVAIVFSVGYFFIATAAMHLREWRALSLALSVTSVVLFIPTIFLQESIRWLVSKGRIDEAEKVIRRVAKFNRKTLPDALFDKEDIEKEMEAKKSAIPPSALDLYKTPNMAVKTLNMQYNWFVNSLVYYGLSQSTGDLGVDDYWAFFVSGAVEIPAMIYATFGVEWFGRKWNTGILEVIGGAACLATIVIPTGTWRIVVAMVGKFCISATFGIIYLYSTELFPTPVRVVGLGLCSVAARVGGILSPIILLLKNSVADLPLILFGSSTVVAGFLALLLPETRGQQLPQTLKEGEEIGRCRCMGRNAYDESNPELVDMDADGEGVFAISNAAFGREEEKKYRDFSQQFSKGLHESSHM